MDKEELIGNLFVIYISPAVKAGEVKRQVVKRYMRTYLRSLTNVELEFEFKFAETNGLCLLLSNSRLTKPVRDTIGLWQCVASSEGFTPFRRDKTDQTRLSNFLSCLAKLGLNWITDRHER